VAGDAQLITSFETYLLTEKRVSQNTFSAYQRDIKQLTDFLTRNKLTLKSVTKTNLKRFLGTLKRAGLKARTQSRKISAIKLFFKFLSERHGIANRAAGLLFPKLEKTLPLYLTEKEIEALFRIAHEDESARGARNHVMLSLLYASGMRISELLSLTTDQINFKTGFVQLMGKGNKERSIPLPQGVLALVRDYLDTTYREIVKDNETGSKPHIFVSVQRGKVTPLTRQAFWMILKKLLAKAYITKKISPHSLRHSLATHLLKNGANLRSLQLLLGHENLSTVQVYTHLEKSDVRKVYDKKHPRA